MFTLGPPLWGGDKDEFAGLVMALLHFNDAPGTQIPVSALGGPTVSNGGGASNQVLAAAAYFGSGGWRGTAGPPLRLGRVPPGANDPYTIEFFFNVRVAGSFNRFFGASNTGSGNSIYLYLSGGTLRVARSSGADVATTGSVTVGAWNYVCLQYNPTGTVTTVDLNGVRVLTTSSFSAIAGTGCAVEINGSGGVGGNDAQVDFDAFRWTNGVRRYPTLAPVPTAPFPSS